MMMPNGRGAKLNFYGTVLNIRARINTDGTRYPEPSCQQYCTGIYLVLSTERDAISSGGVYHSSLTELWKMSKFPQGPTKAVDGKT